MATLFFASLFAILAVGFCGNYTVTDVAYFEIEIKDYDGPGDDYRGRFKIGVFGETCPMTALNFLSIAKGHKRKYEKLWYKNSRVHRIVPDFIVQMGDVTVGDGTGGKSIFGDKFVDENFIISHKYTGLVSMANHGKDTNGSQFFILLSKARWLDNKHVVFGRVISGMDVVRTMADVPTDQETAMPKKSIRIVDSGVEELSRKYDLTEKQLESEADIEL